MIVPEEIIYEIAKYCDESALISLTRSCRLFSNKLVSFEDTEFIKRKGDDIEVNTSSYYENKIWKSAMTYKFGKEINMKINDDLKYFIAKCERHLIIINKDENDIDWIYEYNKNFQGILGFIINDPDKAEYHIIDGITNRFLFIDHYENIIESYSSFSQIMNDYNLKESNEEYGDYTIIDLQYMPYKFFNHELYRQKYEGIIRLIDNQSYINA